MHVASDIPKQSSFAHCMAAGFMDSPASMMIVVALETGC
jgi:hypothetical protein